jgi:hypothetical protein
MVDVASMASNAISLHTFDFKSMILFTVGTITISREYKQRERDSPRKVKRS